MNLVTLKSRARRTTGVRSWRVMDRTVCRLTFSWYQ